MSTQPGRRAGVLRVLACATIVTVGLGITAVPLAASVDASADVSDAVTAALAAVSTAAIASTASTALSSTANLLDATEPHDADATTPVFDAAALPALMRSATESAAARGAAVSAAILDRATGTFVWNGNNDPIATASVSKLFIADDILFRQSTGEYALSPRDAATLDRMLRSSDDAAAEDLWSRFGRSDIVSRVAVRYGLISTVSRPGDAWWNTTTTMSDLIAYYASLADGRGGLGATPTDTILGDLASFTELGADGYDQRFGIPDAVQPLAPVAVKQGWMCCVDGRWIHLSTGYVGQGNRFVVAVGSREISAGWASSTAPAARTTVTRFIADLSSKGSIAP